jgi:ribose transport system substrate-binding protein
VGVTLLTETHVFYQNLRRGMQQAADSLGLDLKIVAGEGDLARQTAQVENFITQRMDAIVIAPVNSSGIASAIEEANRANIPVFTADIAADGGAVVAHVASDNRQGGQLLGEYVARRLGGGGNVVILDQPTVASVRDRVSGFKAALAPYPNIRIVAQPVVDLGKRDLAKEKMDNLLAADQRIDAVFGTNDECALGALAAIQAAGKSGVFVVGYDATPEARSAIARNTALAADAVQDPVTIGRRTIETIVARLHGGTVSPVIHVPVGLVTHDSLSATPP